MAYRLTTFPGTVSAIFHRRKELAGLERNPLLVNAARDRFREFDAGTKWRSLATRHSHGRCISTGHFQSNYLPLSFVFSLSFLLDSYPPRLPSNRNGDEDISVSSDGTIHRYLYGHGMTNRVPSPRLVTKLDLRRSRYTSRVRILGIVN